MAIHVRLTKRDWKVLSSATLLLLAVVIFGNFAVGSLATGIALVLGIAFILFLLLQYRRETFQSHRKTRQNHRETFEQTEALLGLYFGVSGTAPVLPKTRGWGASPGFLRLVYKQIRENEPNLVVELGSGSSTIIGGHALRRNGSGSITSFDHLEKYARQSRELVSFHGLGDYCKVLAAPLTSYRMNGRSWEWYSLEDFDPEEPIDLVIVDGPPGHLQELSRYPALPLLFDWLSEEATFIVDDGDREDEKTMVERWVEEEPKLKAEYRETENGAFILKSD